MRTYTDNRFLICIYCAEIGQRHDIFMYVMCKSYHFWTVGSLKNIIANQMSEFWWKQCFILKGIRVSCEFNVFIHLQHCKSIQCCWVQNPVHVDVAPKHALQKSLSTAVGSFNQAYKLLDESRVKNSPFLFFNNQKVVIQSVKSCFILYQPTLNFFFLLTENSFSSGMSGRFP